VQADGSLECGGSLIAPNIVLTAAHCAEDSTRVQIGRHDRNDANDEYQEFSIRHKLVHPLYVKNKYSYDQMLIVMDGESTTKPIRINRKPTLPAVGSEVTTMGWGVADKDNGLMSPLLMEVTVFVESNSECKDTYSSDKSPLILITPDMLCAADVGQDTCSGDSGGPLILKRLNKRDLLVGVVSWGLQCADPVYPGVYSRTSFVADWIDSNVCLYSKNAPSHFACETTSYDGPFFRLDIQFDRFPQEVGWKLISSVNNTIASRTPLYYGPAFANQLVTEIIPVPAMKTSYTFIVSDSQGDGLCCAYGQGSYRLWKGPLKNNKLLASGDAKAKFREETKFTVSFAPTTTNIAAITQMESAASPFAPTATIITPPTPASAPTTKTKYAASTFAPTATIITPPTPMFAPTTATKSAASTVFSLKSAFGLLAATIGCALWAELQ
jgi:Trypsin